MRDGDGNKLSEDATAKVTAAQVKPGDASLNKVSVDPKSGFKPLEELRDETAAAGTGTAPKF